MSDSLIQRDAAHGWHPFTQAATAPPLLPIVGAEGAWLHLEDGTRIFDAISSWWTINHGHCHPAITAAVAKQAATLDHVLFAGCTHDPAVNVTEALMRIAPPKLRRVFFSDNGSTAVEVALKMAYQYHANKGDNTRQRFVCLKGGYHGDTLGAMSVGEVDAFTEVFRPLLLDTVDSFDSIPSLEALFAARGHEHAALILEPMIQGAGGMIIRPPEFLSKVARLCRDHGVLLIADEVMTGFGRTGTMFACEHADVSPDLMAVAKGLTGGALPIAATLATEHIYQAFMDEQMARGFLHGHSFTANPIGCAAAVASLDLLINGPALERVARLEEVYAQRLPSFDAHPKVADTRWLGSVGVVELCSEGRGYLEPIGARVQAEFIARGFLVRPLGPVVYTLPPYCTTSAELHAVWDAFEEILNTL